MKTLTEAQSSSIILVDFQPAYEHASGYDYAINQALEYINKHKPNVLAFFNGSDAGVDDTKNEVIWHFIEHGLNEDLIYLFEFKEKYYTWLRNWMDEGIDSSRIIKVVRYLVIHHLNDSRDINDEDWLSLVGENFKFYDNREMNIHIPDISISQLKELNNSLMGGGGRDECLAEIQLLMNSFNIKYKLVSDWIYG